MIFRPTLAYSGYLDNLAAKIWTQGYIYFLVNIMVQNDVVALHTRQEVDQSVAVGFH